MLATILLLPLFNQLFYVVFVVVKGLCTAWGKSNRLTKLFEHLWMRDEKNKFLGDKKGKGCPWTYQLERFIHWRKKWFALLVQKYPISDIIQFGAKELYSPSEGLFHFLSFLTSLTFLNKQKWINEASLSLWIEMNYMNSGH